MLSIYNIVLYIDNTEPETTNLELLKGMLQKFPRSTKSTYDKNAQNGQTNRLLDYHLKSGVLATPRKNSKF